jgi:hypothetical protein
MADAPSRSRAAIDWRRVGGFAVVVALCAVIAWKAGEHAYLSRTAEPNDTPASAQTAFDIGNDDMRRALLLLQGGDPEAWLGRECNPTSAETFHVKHLSFGSHVITVREATFVIRGDSLRSAYAGDSPLGPVLRSAELDPDAVARLRAMFAHAGYPLKMPPVVETADCHSPIIVTVDSCIAGRYYGVARMCPDQTVFPLVHRALALARDSAEASR